MSLEAPPAIALEQTVCPLCAADDAQLCLEGRDLLYGVPGLFRLVRCRACGHAYLNPRPTLDTIGSCYPPQYAPHQVAAPAVATVAASAGEESAARGPWYLSSWARRIPGLRALYYWLSDGKWDYVPPVDARPKRALEIGCSTGDYLAQLQSRGWEVRGVEPAETPARLAREQGFDVHVGTLESAALADQAFDAVYAWMVLEHVHDPLATLREIHRVLRPGGWLIFSVPNFGSWERRLFGRYWYALQLPTHLQHFTPRTLARTLDVSGFELIEIVHQRNLNNVLGSLANWFGVHFPGGRLGARLLEATNRPSLWNQLALALPAKFLAFLRQGGRLTVVARKRDRQS